MPDLDPHLGHYPVQEEDVVYVDSTAYEELPGGEQVCPERNTNILSSMQF